MSDDFPNEPIADIVPEGSPDEAMPRISETTISGRPSTFRSSSNLVTFSASSNVQGGGRQWTVPKTVVRRVHKALPIDHVFDLLARARSSAINFARR